jgi:hypothetical protein
MMVQVTYSEYVLLRVISYTEYRLFLELLEEIYVASESVRFTFAIHVPIYGEGKSDDSVSSKAVLDAVENQPSR